MRSVGFGVAFTLAIGVAVGLSGRRGDFSELGEAPGALELRPRPEGRDADRDGLDDGLEDALAEKFAPVIHHGEGETSFPVSVEWWLARTQLSFVGGAESGQTRLIRPAPLQQQMLLNVREDAGGAVLSSATRSRLKVATFFLDNVAEPLRAGSLEPAEWITYVHSYSNTRGGVTLQFWRAYAWNDARYVRADFGHGGDWEAIAVHLDASLRPAEVAFLQHSGIVYQADSVRWEGTHPLVFSQEGGHSSAPTPAGLRSARTIRQETWTRGRTTSPTGEDRGVSGGLLNVGEKSYPRHNQVFIQYSGLWGTPRRFFIRSGYWGPAFNETGARCSDGSTAYAFGFVFPAARQSCGRIFFNAWCDGMAAGALDVLKECYAPHERR